MMSEINLSEINKELKKSCPEKNQSCCTNGGYLFRGGALRGKNYKVKCAAYWQRIGFSLAIR